MAAFGVKPRRRRHALDVLEELASEALAMKEHLRVCLERSDDAATRGAYQKAADRADRLVIQLAKLQAGHG